MGIGIGEYFKRYVVVRGIARERLGKRLGFSYADNERMICAWFKKADKLWKQSDVERWCTALGISESSVAWSYLMERAGKKDIDG